MVAHALTWSMDTNVFAKSHTPAAVVITKWIHAIRISVTMAQNAHQFQTIKISHAVARLATLDACAIKTSTNVHCRHRVAMEPHAKIFPVHTNACVPMAMKDETVPLIRMIVLRSRAQTVAPVWMELATLPVYVWMVLKANIVKLISTNVLRVSSN